MTHKHSTKVGLAGLGLMGHGIGRNLLRHGYSLKVLGHVNRKPVDSLVGLGAAEAANPGALARESDVVILCVTGSPQVEDLVYRDDGLLANFRPGQILIDCSTSNPVSSARIAQSLDRVGALFVDAPLGRTPVEAEAGTLNCMVGAAPEVLERIRPILAAFCENVFHIGETLSAQKLKLINNFVVVGAAALFAEALRSCGRLGVSRQALYDLMSKGPLQSGLLQAIVGESLHGRLDGMKFSVANAAKDLGYFNALVTEFSDAGALAPDVARVLAQAVEAGMGDSFLPELVNVEAR